MKQITLENITPRMDSHKYYGVISTGVSKGYISREKFEMGSFVLLAPDDATEGNRWSDYTGENLNEILTILLNSKKFLVFQFDKYQQLFRWLSRKATATERYLARKQWDRQWDWNKK